MEYLVAASIISAGYVLSKKDKIDGKIVKPKRRISENRKPNGATIYQEKMFQKAEHIDSKKAQKLISQYNRGEPVVIPGPPEAHVNGPFKKIDYNDNGPIVSYDPNKENNLIREFDNIEVARRSRIDNEVKPYVNTGFNAGCGLVMSLSQDSITPKNIIENDNKIMSLTGQVMKRDDFVHNNMVPFFGSTIKQNVDEKSTSTMLENFTGNMENYRQKSEVPSFFDVKTNVHNVYGMQNMDESIKERYYISDKRNNEAPIEQIRVGPGLNKGYTAQPSGGFQQADTRDYVIPKTVDELRVKTNPKQSFEGRVIAGVKVARPAKVGEVAKNRPDRFYVNNPDRYFTAVGAVTGATQRPLVYVKPQNRKETTKERIGTAGPINGTKATVRPDFKETTRQQLNNGGWRNLEKIGSWLGLNFDWGKKGMDAKRTRKQDTEEKSQLGVAEGLVKRGTLNNNNVRDTRKTNVIGNARQAGNVDTVKHGYVNNPNDQPRTTVKETTIDNDYLGQARREGAEHGYVNDPNDQPRTTVKETTIDNDYLGTAKREGPEKGYILDPNDTPKATNKQNTMNKDYMGGANEPNKEGSYNVTHESTEAKETNRQNTTVDYTGNVGGGVEVKPMSYDDIYNATINSLREESLASRVAGKDGPKTGLSVDKVNMTTMKTGDIKNKAITDRGLAPTRIINSLPQTDNCSETKHKMSLPNELIQNRLDPDLLNVLDENPYAQPGFNRFPNKIYS